MADSTTSSSIYGTSVSTSGVGGLMSGLDTKTLVEQMAQASQIKINRQFQAKQKLVYQQESFRDLIGKMVSFNDKYFSYSSKTNILSRSFFTSNTVTSSNDNVKVSGDTSQIQKFQINSIDSVATSSSYISSGAISAGNFDSFDAIFSGDTSIVNSKLAGHSFTLSVDKLVGADTQTVSQTLTFGSDFQGKTLQDVADELNNQIEASGSKLNGSVEYSVVGGKLELSTKTGASNAKVTSVTNGVKDLLNIDVNTNGSSSAAVTDASLYTTTSFRDVLLNSTISFNLNGISKTIKFNAEDIPETEDMLTADDSKIDSAKLQSKLQDKLNTAFGSGKIAVSSAEGKLSFETVDNYDVFSVNSISTNLKKLTGITAGSANRISTSKSVKDLFSDLSGTQRDKYSVRVNGKTVDFDASTESLTIDNIINKIQDEADVKVEYSGTTGKFTITDKTDSDKTYTISDVDDGKLASALLNGTNKYLDTTKSIYDSNISGLVTEEYKLSVNDVDFKFDNTDTVSSVLRDINNSSEAGVTITYSSVTDKFSMVSKETGSHTRIDIKDASVGGVSQGNLVEKLFGEQVHQTTDGQDTKLNVTLNGEKIDINRSTSSFTLDGITVELNSKAADASITETNPVTFTASANVDDVAKKVSEFVDEYNKLIDALDTAVTETPNKGYSPLTAAQREEMTESEEKLWDEKAKAGMLYCNSTVSQALYDLRNAAATYVDGMSLSDIGISSSFGDYTGKLVFDEDAFKQAFAENPEKVTELFTKDDSTGKGVSAALKDVVYNNVGLKGEKGLFAEQAGTKNTSSEKTNFLTERIKEYEELITKLEKKMKEEKERYWTKFTNLETALANFSSQSSMVSSMFQ